MSTGCTRCENSGFLNLSQIPVEDLQVIEKDGDAEDKTFEWMSRNPASDVQVCDCCGDGEEWYGIPGEHYNSDDPQGPNGPYASNGGLCHCH